MEKPETVCRAGRQGRYLDTRAPYRVERKSTGNQRKAKETTLQTDCTERGSERQLERVYV